MGEIQIITIERKILNVKITTNFLAENEVETKPEAQLVGSLHSLIPGPSLINFETVQFDLKKSNSELFAEMHKETRRQIRRAEEKEFKHVVIENPTNEELKNFQIYYNQFAKSKKTNICNSFHMRTLKLLRDKKAMILTYIEDGRGNILCYRIYITDSTIAMNLYSASHFRSATKLIEQNLLGQANRLLIWKSIVWFKEKGHKLYDMGGLTDDANIRRFKIGFGGEISTVYSGYVAHSKIGGLIIRMRNLKIALSKSKEFT